MLFIFRKWVEMYREHCHKLEKGKAKINRDIDQSSLSRSQKLGILDERENQRTCSGNWFSFFLFFYYLHLKTVSISLDLVSTIESKQMLINQMVENILVFKKPFLDALEVVDSVLEMKDGPTIINGKELLSSVSRDDLERYQSLHSVR